MFRGPSFFVRKLVVELGFPFLSLVLFSLCQALCPERPMLQGLRYEEDWQFLTASEIATSKEDVREVLPQFAHSFGSSVLSFSWPHVRHRVQSRFTC